MKAKIVTIGDEILIGDIVDTNSTYIARRLNDIGLRVVSNLSVGDDEVDIRTVLEDAMVTADVTIVTGGLGPTKDDITKKTLAKIFGGGMREDVDTYRMIEEMLAQRGVDFNTLNKGQALVPKCCRVLPNRNGTAPGMWFERGGAILISLPGVPFEMEQLMESSVLPQLSSSLKLDSIVHRSVVVVGLPESELATTIEQWEDSLPHYLALAYLPSPACIRLRLSAYEVDSTVVMLEIERQFSRLKEIIPDNTLENGAQTIEAAVAELLTTHGVTLSLAESCTGGAVASRFTAMSGASTYFLGGVVAYSNEIKVSLLGVPTTDIELYGAVSREVVEQMALGVQRLTGSDYAISITGVAGPTGGTENNPVGTVWIAVAHPNGVVSRKFNFGTLRQQNIDRAVASGIDMLRKLLIRLDHAPNDHSSQQ